MEASVPAVAQEPCSDPGTRPELRIPNAAAHTPAQIGSNEQLSPCRREIADRFDRVKAGASRPRAARGYGLDSAKSISATATAWSSRCADRYDGRPKARHRERSR